MTTPTIILKRLNLMGYTPETQVWFIQNGGGGQKTFEYMQGLSQDRDAQQYRHMGRVSWGVRGTALAREFARECLNRGFKVEWQH